MKGVLICGELEKKEISSISKELISTGQKLQNSLDQSLDFLLIGENLRERAEEAAILGVNKVLIVEGPEFSEFQTVAHPPWSDRPGQGCRSQIGGEVRREYLFGLC